MLQQQFRQISSMKVSTRCQTDGNDALIVAETISNVYAHK
jgi:hypothetical protein